MITPTAKRLRTILALMCAMALVATGLSLGSASAQENPDVLNASEMPMGVIDSSIPVGRYIVNATASAAVEVDGQNRTGGEHSFTQRLKLNGSGNANQRSVSFNTVGPAVLNAYALSASAGADRELALYTEDGTELQRQPAYGAPTDIPLAMFEVPEAGSYYVASPSSGVNIFYLELIDGPAPERPAWDGVADPVITEVTISGGEIVVEFDGVVGFAGADRATATLYDEEGVAVATGLSGTQGSAGSIALSPVASGDYAVEVALQRTDEDEAKLSERVDAPSFTLPLETSEIISALTSAVTGDTATLTVEWRAVPEAERYTLAYRAADTDGWTELDATAGTGLAVPGLTPGQSYELRVTAERGEDITTSPIHEVTVASVVERWLESQAGVSSNGSLNHNVDGSMTFDMMGNNGKIADSEDGFLYYYTQIDPETENWTMSATFTVDDASGKDNQSGFGLIAIDTFEPGVRDARYFNSAGTMAAKYARDVGGNLDVRYGTPGSKIVTGYTDGPRVATPARDMSLSEPFDWDFRDGMTEGSNVNPPRFVNGDVWEFTLRKSNTGFHSTWVVDGEVVEIINYDPELLLQQTDDSYYAGVFAARNVVVTVSDFEFTTIHPDDDDEPLERPTTYITPWVSADVTRTTPHNSLELPLLSNVHGEAVILDANGVQLAGPVDLEPNVVTGASVVLADGANDYTVVLTPAPREEQTQLGDYEDLDSYDPVETSVGITVNRFGEPGQSLYVAPDGTADGSGHPSEPLDLHTAIAYVQPGQQIILLPGTYQPTSRLLINRGNNGTDEEPIVMMSEPGSRAVLDLSESPNGGIHLRGDHWHLYNLEIVNSRGYQKPLLIGGHHNVVERIESHHNADTGIQISGSATEPPSMWPSHNLVVSSVAHNNADPLANDADGFAAKITSGDGNVFRYNIAYHNIDDGWDLYAKSTEGPIGDVVVEHSVAFRNGWLEADTERELVGEGNGFKLGGENQPGAHRLFNSVTFDNAGTGVTSNSGPDVEVVDVTSYANDRANLNLYTGEANTTDYEVDGFLSAAGGARDSIGLRGQDDDIRTNPSNIFDGVTAGGEAVTDDWFVRVDLDIKPRIAADGSIDMQGLLELVEDAPLQTGAFLTANPNPTQIDVLPPVSAGDDDGDVTPPTVTVKEGAEFTVGSAEDGYEMVSFKLFDEGLVDKVVINGVEKDLTDNTWSDVNFVKPGVFGAVLGANTMEVYDVAGNVTTVEFTLVEPAPEAPAWDASQIYTAGDEVSYQGAVFVALWWTQGQVPGNPTGAWAEVGALVPAAGDDVRAWAASWVYTGGEIVAYEGRTWQAKWWTRNQAPGDAWGPWEDLGQY